MSERIIKVIHMAPLRTGGITKLTVSINQLIDREKIRFDYLVFCNQREFMEDTIEKLGSKKQVVDLTVAKNPLHRFFLKMIGMTKLFKREEYDFVHVDASTPYDVIVAIAAKIAGVKSIILHAHNDAYKKGNLIKDMIMPFCRLAMNLCCTDYFAISEPAAKFMFPKSVLKNKKYSIIKNGIIAEEYVYDEQRRNKVRTELNVDDDTFVLGNIGRFVYQKNHDFMLEVFSELCKIRENSLLLLVGEGVLFEEIKQKAENLKISDKVCFYGVTHNVPDVLNAMDAFIFPSRFEGLGIVAVEAQAVGLDVWCARTIPEEAKVCENFRYIEGNDPSFWAKTILNHNVEQRENKIKNVKNAGYDLKTVAKDMQEFYCSQAR